MVGLAKCIIGGKLDLTRIEKKQKKGFAQLLLEGLVHGQCKTFNVWAWTEKYVSESDIGIQRAYKVYFN